MRLRQTYSQRASRRFLGVQNFVYLGAFKLDSSFDFGATALGMGPVVNGRKTIMCGNNRNSASAGLGIVYIPQDSALNSTGSTTATSYIRAPTSGSGLTSLIKANSAQTNPTSLFLGGSYHDAPNNRILLTYFWFFPSSYNDGSKYATYNTVSVQITGVPAAPIIDSTTLVYNLQIGSATVGSPGIPGGNLLDGSNYCILGPVDPSWQATVGGTTLGSQGALSIQGLRSSQGPVLSVFNLPAITSGVQLPATTLAWYGDGAQSNLWIDAYKDGYVKNTPPYGWSYGVTGGLAAYRALSVNAYWSWGDSVGVPFVSSLYRTVAIVGTHGAGIQIYGAGKNATPANAGTVWHDSQFTLTLVANSPNVVASNVTGLALTNGSAISQVDADGFFTTTPGLPTGSGAAATFIENYNSVTGAATLQVSGAAASPTVSGSFSFVSASAASTIGADVFVYDPTSSNHGQHAYPYSMYLWLYDLDQFSGNSTPLPYYVGPFPLPSPALAGYGLTGSSEGWAEFDTASNRLYAILPTSGPNGGSPTYIGVWQLT